jgi:hypothetical protein
MYLQPAGLFQWGGTPAAGLQNKAGQPREKPTEETPMKLKLTTVAATLTALF